MENEHLKSFGKHIKVLRKGKGLTLAELADKIGYSNPYLSQIENGKRKRPPTPEFLRHLAAGLGVAYSEMLQLAGYEDLARGQLNAEISHSEKIHLVEQSLKENSDLSDGLKSFREMFEYTHEELSKITGLPALYLRGLENDEVESVDQNTLAIIAKAYESKTPESVSVYATLLVLAGLIEDKDDIKSADQSIVDSLKEHTKNVYIDMEIKEAQDSIIILDGALTAKEMNIIRDFVEILVKNRDGEMKMEISDK